MLPIREVAKMSMVNDYPGGGVQQADEGSASDLAVNNLVYKQPDALSLVKTRTSVKSFFQRDVYGASASGASGETAICDINSGVSFVDCANSYLGFNLTLTTTAPSWTFGEGSCMNIIQSVVIRTRSGTEVSRLDSANLWSVYDIRYHKSQLWRDTVGSVMGIGDTTHHFQYGVQTTPFLIPLSELSPFFRPLKQQLLPPQLASGLHVEIVFAPQNTAFVATAAVTKYEVSDIHFMMDSVQMSDETLKTINMESAQNGLEWVCPAVYTSINSLSATTKDVSVQINKSVSQCLGAVAIFQNTAILNDGTVDSFVTNLGAFTVTSFQYQWRIGSLYFPHQTVVENSQVSRPQAYSQAMLWCDRFKHPSHECSVSMRDYLSTDGVLAFSANKTEELFLSGLPVNNSRNLEFNFSFTGTDADRRLTVFMDYITVVRCWSTNTAIAI